MSLTNADMAYLDAVNAFGSDPESPEEHSILHNLHAAAEASHQSADDIED